MIICIYLIVILSIYIYRSTDSICIYIYIMDIYHMFLGEPPLFFNPAAGDLHQAVGIGAVHVGVAEIRRRVDPATATTRDAREAFQERDGLQHVD